MSNIHIVSQHHKYIQALPPQDVATGADVVTGDGVDCERWEGLLAICNIGAVAANAGTKSVTCILQESSDDADADAYADIALATTGAVVNAGENEPYLIDVNLSERERYIRVTIDGGSGDGGLVGVVFVLYRGRRAMPTQTNTVVQIGWERA